MDAARRCLLQLIAHLCVNTMMAFGGPIWWPQRAAHLGANSEMKLEYNCRPLTEKTYNGLTISAPGLGCVTACPDNCPNNYPTNCPNNYPPLDETTSAGLTISARVIRVG